MSEQAPERSGTVVFGWGALLILTRSAVTAGLLMFAARVLSAEQLGVWMVWLSAYSLLALLEFAVATTLLRAAASAWSGAPEIAAWGLAELPSATSQEQRPNWSLLQRLRRAGTLIGAGLAAVLALSLVIATTWNHALLVSPAASAFAVTFALQPLGVGHGPILGGIGRWWQYQAVQLFGWLAHGFVSGLCLWRGMELEALPLGYAALLVVSRGGAWHLLRRVSGAEPAGASGTDLLTILWPNLWRLLALAFASYLILQANVLVCATQVGLAAAAVYGFSLQATNLVGQLSAVAVQMRTPHFASLRASGQWRLLAIRFADAVRLQILLFIAGGVTLWVAGPTLLGWIGLRTPLLPSALLACLLIIVFLETHHSQYGSLVLTENRNPFLVAALASGGLIAALAWILAPRLGIAGILLAQGVVQLSYNNWWTVRRGVEGLQIAPAEYWRGFLSGRWPAVSEGHPSAESAAATPAAADPAKAP